MPLAGEFEDELELQFQRLEAELQFEPDPSELGSRSLIEFRVEEDFFIARLSGFDPLSDTSSDPDVVQLHKAAIQRIVHEVMLMTAQGCVRLIVIGFADSLVDFGNRGPTDKRRADAIAQRIWAAIPKAKRDRVDLGRTRARRSPLLWPGQTHAQRALNRRVEVEIHSVPCT